MRRLNLLRRRFLEVVPDEAAAEQLLVKIRWPHGVTCAHCGSHEVTRLATRPLWQCRICRHQTSVRSGTVLHRTRKPLLDWLYTAWVCGKSGGASTRSLAAQLEYRYETLWVILHKLRAALAERGVWQLSGEVDLTAAVLPVARRAKGDPEIRKPAVIALASSPGPDTARMLTAAHPDQPDAELLEAARVAHVELTAEVRVEPGRLRLPGFSCAPRPLANLYRGVKAWLTYTFGGVSRRYLPNYLAQFTYRVNRWAFGDRRFDWMVRRLVCEPWRPRREIALATP